MSMIFNSEEELKPMRSQFLGGGMGATFSRTQNPVIEVYLGTLQPCDFPYLPVCFVAICKL